MSSLRRVRAGSFSEDEAVLIADVEKAVSDGRIGALIKPVDSLFAAYPPVYIDARQKAKCLNGAEFAVDLNDGLCRVYDSNHEFLMLGQADGGTMRTVKSFFDV